jgi:predicted Fe-Mo cluster-binding NifX family protein
MKTVITAVDCNFDSLVSDHFARCNYFVIYDHSSHSVEFLPNPYKNISELAGSKVIEMLNSRGVNKIVSIEFGNRAKQLLDSLLIQMIVVKNKKWTVNEIIQLLKKPDSS